MRNQVEMILSHSTFFFVCVWFVCGKFSFLLFILVLFVASRNPHWLDANTHNSPADTLQGTQTHNKRCQLDWNVSAHYLTAAAGPNTRKHKPQNSKRNEKSRWFADTKAPTHKQTEEQVFEAGAASRQSEKKQKEEPERVCSPQTNRRKEIISSV